MTTTEAVKRCTKCGEVKSLDQFYRNSRSPDGHQSWCKDCANKHHRDYYQRNREQKLAQKHLYYLDHKEQASLYNHKLSQQRRVLVIAHYSGNTNRCACCGEPDIRFLTIDHIDGNGAQHRRKISVAAGDTFYRWLIKEGLPEGYQVLCYNCNCARSRYGICPHKSADYPLTSEEIQA